MISPEYRQLNEGLHQSNSLYGTGGAAHKDKILELFDKYNTQDALDYGCGKGKLAEVLPVKQYDPAIPEHSKLPEPADIVICSDVLEHIEPEYLDGVLNHLRELTRTAGYFVISLREASKTLPDGRNAHLIVQPAIWWIAKLSMFEIVSQEIKDKTLYLEVV
jgi:2-polyprenyl-3-methyl-5-hydroxy-6-metoxy-1,4-benzoquinol methylase